MLALSDALAALAEHPRAQPWELRLHAGWSTAAGVRPFTLFAPPTAAAVGPVLYRLHNALLLRGAAAAELHVPVAPTLLEPLLGQLRAVHKVPIVLDRAPAIEAGSPIDLPSADDAQHRPPGPGLAIGLDIGGTGMKVIVLDGATTVRAVSAPTWPDGEAGIDSLVARARALVIEAAAGQPVGSLGVGLAAPMGVHGRVLELSTVLRERVGDPVAFERFGERVAEGLVDGPVAVYNDLANLGRWISHQGRRRLVRLQIGTSFGGTWIDTNGDVVAVEMGRLVVDVGPDAVPHPYLPIAGAMRGYLCNGGLATFLAPRVGHPVDARVVGHLLRGLLDAGDAAGEATVRWMSDVLVGVVHELVALLPGIQAVEVGGSMLHGPAGRRLGDFLGERAPVPVKVADRPGLDGAIAAAMGPRLAARLKGTRRIG